MHIFFYYFFFSYKHDAQEPGMLPEHVPELETKDHQFY